MELLSHCSTESSHLIHVARTFKSSVNWLYSWSAWGAWLTRQVWCIRTMFFCISWLRWSHCWYSLWVRHYHLFIIRLHKRHDHQEAMDIECLRVGQRCTTYVKWYDNLDKYTQFEFCHTACTLIILAQKNSTNLVASINRLFIRSLSTRTAWCAGMSNTDALILNRGHRRWPCGC